MTTTTTTPLVLEQYDYLPYPAAPIEINNQDAGTGYFYSFATPVYIKSQKIPNTPTKILDAGCGTGVKTMRLAMANPTAVITGIDLSPNALELARQRAAHNGRPDITFRQCALEDIASLGQTWDYINAQDVMYMVPDTVAALKALKSVLSDDGIIRFDFHAKYVRGDMLRAQQACRLLGMYDQNPEEKEVALVKELMGALDSHVNLKQRCWGPGYEQGDQSMILMNQLIQGDRAWTIKEVFNALAEAELEFVQMVNWMNWSVQALFKDQTIPPEIEKRLLDMSDQQVLEFVELLHPSARLPSPTKSSSLAPPQSSSKQPR
jgi:SAM-dependent methyltransferase